jgi:hypothetical protein
MIAWAIISAVILPLLLSEFSEVSPWMARRLLVWAAVHVGDPRRAERYREEWLAGLQDVPGNLTKLVKALSIVCYTVPVMHWHLKGSFYLWPARKLGDAFLALTFPRIRRRLLKRRIERYGITIGRKGSRGSTTIGELRELMDIGIMDAVSGRVLRGSQNVSGSGPLTLELDHRRRRLVLHGLRHVPRPSSQQAPNPGSSHRVKGQNSRSRANDSQAAVDPGGCEQLARPPSLPPRRALDLHPGICPSTRVREPVLDARQSRG